jgi:glutamine---fructose-6-phosphate transaminase (isomerizing)
MTKFLKDILRQPQELQRSLDYLSGPGKNVVEEAVSVLKSASHIYVTGMGSSWHAAIAAAAIFHDGGRPVYQVDAAELVHFGNIPRNSAIIVLSRTGRSIEIVQLLSKARSSGAKVIGLTNAADGPLARQAGTAIVLEVGFDHGISVNTYSTLALAAGALAHHVLGSFNDLVRTKLSSAIESTGAAIESWRGQVEKSSWFAPGRSYYFLGRGPSLGSCHEVRLLWEEGVKSPATAMGTGAFRHGPQEIVVKGMRFGMWVDPEKMREQDLAVARDLSRLGAEVMLVGQNLSATAAELVFLLPPIPPGWQFITDIVPGQLAAERLSRLSGTDCDSFRLCSYIVEDEAGLLPAATTEGDHTG